MENDKLESLAADSDNIICSVKTVFPFQIFPSVLSVEKTKIIFIRYFFLGHHAESMLINNISSVKLENAYFLSSIEIVNNIPYSPKIVIPYLPSREAREVVEIIQGLMIAYETKTDVTKITSEELVDPMKKIGSTKIEELEL
ncbi:PH domain-containing protein [Patescibacteria group bacterium]|nr:PH domain-containing protein [Patescibacteria group bacterium]